MYIFSVIKNIFKVSNIGTIIFFLLNTAVIVGIFAPFGADVLIGVAVLYLISICIALSPVGEWFLGFMSGARKMRRRDMRERVEPLLKRVHQKALEMTPDLTEVIILKVSHDSTPNAFALGRHTVCVTEGLLDLPENVIEGILAHEIGHLANHHTDIQLLIGGGNFIITTLIFVVNAISGILSAIGVILGLRRNTSCLGCVFSLAGIVCSVIMWLWTKFCMLFLMWSSRANEYVADKYAMDLGYGYELAAGLDMLSGATPRNSFLKALYSTHPQTHDRIAKLQEMGVAYSRYSIRR